MFFICFSLNFLIILTSFECFMFPEIERKCDFECITFQNATLECYSKNLTLPIFYDEEDFEIIKQIMIRQKK